MRDLALFATIEILVLRIILRSSRLSHSVCTAGPGAVCCGRRFSNYLNPSEIRMRRWIFRAHLWLALAAGAFFVLLGLTGSIIAFESPIDHISHPYLSYVSPFGRYLPLTEIFRSVKRSYPEDDIVAISFSDSPVLAWQVTTPSGIVYVNPHTGHVLGVRQRGETILGFARDLHVSLAAGSIGRTAIRWCDLAAILLLVSGFTLWWPRRTLRLHGFDGTRRSWSDLHNVIGIFSFIFLFVASGTGAIISLENPLRTIVLRFTGPEPASASPLPAAPQDKPFLPPDQALALASASLPGTCPAQMTMPAYGGTYRFSMIEPRRFSSYVERSISLDPWSGKVLYVSPATNPSLTYRLISAIEAFHTGSAFGLLGRSAMALAGVMLLPQALSGLIMFWKRTRTRNRPTRTG